MLLYLMAGMYIFFGITHFTNQQFFEDIVPGFLPNPRAINFISGAAEILMGIGLLVPETRVFTAWVLIIFLIVVFPANIVQIYQWSEKFKIPAWMFWIIRSAVQLLAIYGAYLFT